MKISDIPSEILQKIRKGSVIPAHPLALTENREIDEESMRALNRYYMDAGAGGIAVGVHSTQFEIRESGIDLLKPILQMVSENIDEWSTLKNNPVCKISGICGKRDQALAEAELATDFGYHASLLSLSAMKDADIPALIDHCRAVAKVIPIIGFYLQPAVGGRSLPYEFWRQFAEIENVLAIKMAPFNRYQTLDVIRGVCDAGRVDDITLYTGNDDNIVADLLTPYTLNTPKGMKTVRIRGGLLGHWCVWTRRAVELLDEIHKITENNLPIPAELLTRGIQITDSNAAFFDSANGFAGCIPGLHEVLYRQGLMRCTRCLNPNEILSTGQLDEINRVHRDYPYLNDDAFVAEHLKEWRG